MNFAIGADLITMIAFLITIISIFTKTQIDITYLREDFKEIKESHNSLYKQIINLDKRLSLVEQNKEEGDG